MDADDWTPMLTSLLLALVLGGLSAQQFRRFAGRSKGRSKGDWDALAPSSGRVMGRIFLVLSLWCVVVFGWSVIRAL